MDDRTNREPLADIYEIDAIRDPRTFSDLDELIGNLIAGKILRVYIEATNPKTEERRHYEIHEIPVYIERESHDEDLKVVSFIGRNEYRDKEYEIKVVSGKDGELVSGTIKEYQADQDNV